MKIKEIFQKCNPHYERSIDEQWACTILKWNGNPISVYIYPLYPKESGFSISGLVFKRSKLDENYCTLIVHKE